MKLLSPPPSLSRPTSLFFFFTTNPKGTKPISSSVQLFQYRSKNLTFTQRMDVKACVKVEQKKGVAEVEETKWRKVSAVLFDMDGVLCNSEEPSRLAAVDVFAEMGVDVTVEDFVPFMGTGEANFLGGVANVKGVQGFNTDAAKKRFFEIYLEKYAKPNSGIGFPGALELITQCKEKGLKVAVASSADRIKVDANLAAAGLPLSMFDAIVSADAFENLKPAPDIFLAASKILEVPPSECIVIEDALAGVQAAQAAQMRCIAVKTTLSEETLSNASPSLIRNDIGSVSLDDILSGGSDGYNEKMQGPQVLHTSEPTSAAMLEERPDNGSFPNNIATNDSVGGLQASRRNILRYGSLGIALSCLFFTISNWKAMQYASPQAIWNLLFRVNKLDFEKNENTGKSQSRVQQFVNYISDLETRETARIVPEFPAKLDWLNTAPLQFRRELKGKVVILDFWTYCCINCMHVLPDLEFLEKKYKDMPFTVVGVHSAKFDNEKDLEAIRNAVLRYNISHPVVNDGDMYLWRELGISSWPTFALVGPNGKLLAQISGEGHRKDLDELVEAALLYYGGKKILDSTSIPLSLEKDNDPRLVTSPLKFPGKLAIDVLNKRLFISDSNHNRIVVTDLDGNFIVQIGSTGEEGLRDGPFDEATFNRPQGLAYNAKKNLLYVADTENHALREIDFVNEMVRTLAGNGTKGSDYVGGQKGTIQVLNSPWDVCFEPVNEKVYIAMAGQHQIWEHNNADGVTRAFSGDGYERNLNGSSSTSTSFAQPSGISLSPDLKEVYIADSESSSIRVLDLTTGGSRLLAGGDPIFSDNLFKFGDHDGIGSEVLLQHPLGVLCAKNGQIYVADSYNHKIKKLDPATKRVSTIAGTGKAGFKDGKALAAQLSEPSGIIEAENGRLIIADTNNSIIRYLDLNKEEAELRTLELKGVQPTAPKSKSLKRLRRRSSADVQTIKIDGGSSKEGDLCLKISLPEEYHFSKEARSKFIVETEPENAVLIDPSDGYLSPEGTAILHFRRSSASASTGRINCKVYYCKEDEVCLYESLQFEVPFQEVQDSIPSEITVAYAVKPKASTNSLQLPVSR
ncbi:protein SUPPRESSOR OF QUENCHING 1, chloroplastic isoform X1 [Ricinus communis]|uniref:protein SUPPRESSOR OF QUENCHING 1, chloroplastic isoform X1 n=1 Tax=Ricinus communis TaxID=3988 RepID=UPI00077229B6|nr:protein SUPPRESSOR OF QUENCHING 1, chloroplastic isoform X1 [Ricinus communis]|eukprot:XP_015570646.1 protein SUPPRESSOR OF QUENCHING 1, chloroplastic isoform X1 [Ricinus communis]